MTDSRLNIVDENSTIIGEATREEIHRKGLLHREVGIWFYTPRGELIFQHRGKDKDTFPDILDATVAGHVEIGQDYENAAIKEMREETGVIATADALQFIETNRVRFIDPVTNKVNNRLKAVYAYRYDGSIDDLRVEKGKAMGFEAWSFDHIFNVDEKDIQRFGPDFRSERTRAIFRKIQRLIEQEHGTV